MQEIRKSSVGGIGPEVEIFQTLVENSNELTIVTDNEGVVLYVSPQSEAVLGHPAETVLGTTFPGIIHTDDVERCRHAWASVAYSGVDLRDFEYRIVDKDDNVHWISHSAKRLEIGGNCIGTHSNVRNITAYKKAEEALLASQHFNEAILNASPDVIYVYDIIKGKNVYSNNGIMRVLGYSVEEIKAFGEEVIAKLMHSEDFDKYYTDTLPKYQTIEDGEFVEHEYRMRHKSGKWCWLHAKEAAFKRDSDGRVEQIFGLITDITKRREHDSHIRLAQAALMESENKYRRLFENMGSAFALHEMLLNHDREPIDYIFLEVNDEFEKMTGLRRHDLIGKRVTHVIPGIEKDSADWIEKYGKVAMEGETLRFVQFSEPLRRWYAVVAYSPCERQFATIFTDITEQKRLEEQLVESEKMKAIGQLAGGIAHDFNNQLAGIVGYADLLSSTAMPGTPAAEYSNKILVATERAAGLTSQLLAFARKGKYLSVSVDMRALVGETVDIVSHTVDRRIAIETTSCVDPAIVEGDPSQLQNAILNLAINARDAISEGGSIFFDTALVELDDSFCKSHPFEIKPGSYVRLSVKDTGCGMDEAVQARMFEPFFTTKDVQRGTGMGLAAVYGTVKNHGGAIQVMSAPGEGTTVRVFLPYKPDVVLEKPISDKPATFAGTAHILLVDDEAVVVDICRAMLGKLGFTVATCTNGVDAVTHYENNWETIDLVILDIVMPEMDGRTAFTKIREVNPEAPVLLSSGFSIDGDAERMLETGACGFIPKPFRLPELSRSLTALLEG